MRQRQLVSLFASLLPLAAGCTSPIGDFTSKVCVESPGGLGKLSLSTGTDFLALRSHETPLAGGAQDQEITRSGTPCLTASEPSKCESTLASLPSTSLFTRSDGVVGVSYELPFTRGDDVRSASSADDVVAVLGPIDTPGEAALLAAASGYTVPCGENNVRKVGTSYVLLGAQGTPCVDNLIQFELTVAASGAITRGESEMVMALNDQSCSVGGRRPAALLSRTRPARSVGQFFSELSHLEAASVIAFDRLADELVAHRAPRTLVRAARRSRRDEVAHARTTGRLARRFGAREVAPVTKPQAIRSLLDIAKDNAAEGCVRETFGAMVALVQSKQAADPVVRSALVRIAKDETRHAALSWALDDWMRLRLSRAERAELDEMIRSAVATLAREVEREWDPEIRRVAGMPDRHVAAKLLSALDSALFRSSPSIDAAG